MHPYFTQKPLIEVCRKYDIVVTAYGPLGRPGLSQDPGNDPILSDDATIRQMASKYGRSVAQILLRYLVYGVRASFDVITCFLNPFLFVIADDARTARHPQVV